MISYNCTGYNSQVIGELISKSPDILCLQETWHNPAQTKQLLRLCGSDYMCFEHSCVDITKPKKRGRPHGGLAIYIHKRFSHITSLSEKKNFFGG